MLIRLRTSSGLIWVNATQIVSVEESGAGSKLSTLATQPIIVLDNPTEILTAMRAVGVTVNDTTR